MATQPIEELGHVERKLPAVLEIIRENIMKHGNPLALNGTEVSSWAKNMNLPKTGDLLFYTGGEYQLLPFIDSLVKTISVVDQGSKLFAMAIGVRNSLEKATGINAEKIYASVLSQDKERYQTINTKAARILQSLGYDLCYSGDEELYSGALLYELGYWEDLKEYAPRVQRVLQKSGAKTLVCLSPHAAEVLKFVYPKLGISLNIEIKTFVELVWEQRYKLEQASSAPTVVIHDSCRLARELHITEELRDILTAVGIEFREAERSKEWTTCCGGPSKLLFPQLSHTMAERRVKELQETGAELMLTSCPYCLSALEGALEKKDKNQAVDLIEFLYRGIAR
ncbi:(Fe-S)-binding protein [Desulfitobacterium sp.]|uniref:(Fe-S)-binding protein n=1 Tax=Desulfitobacterium sp. TaxID=49981 RepID=UPI002D1BAEC1|nr:(Fe-S)-binding protein [Desulfitobacterium sp.]HVJ48717.1 (Fe-S)-binding protein [Desulfitobacterium sp.]